MEVAPGTRSRLGELGTREYCTHAVAWQRYIPKWLSLLMPSLPCTQVPARAVCTVRLHPGHLLGVAVLGLVTPDRPPCTSSCVLLCGCAWVQVTRSAVLASEAKRSAAGALAGGLAPKSGRDGWFLGLLFAAQGAGREVGGSQRHIQPGMAKAQLKRRYGYEIRGIRGNTPVSPRCVSPLPSWCRPTPAPRSPGP